jgi:hypothetical protein
MKGLAQREIGTEINSNQLPTHFTESPSMNGRDYLSAAAEKLPKENYSSRRII